MVYSFEYRHADGRDPGAYAGEILRAVDAWHERGRGAIGSLSYRRGPDFLVLTDRRPGLAPAEYRLDGAEAALYLACEDGATLEKAHGAVLGTGIDVDPDEVLGFLAELVEARLMFEEDGQYLSLALPTSPGLAARPGMLEREDLTQVDAGAE